MSDHGPLDYLVDGKLCLQAECCQTADGLRLIYMPASQLLKLASQPAACLPASVCGAAFESALVLFCTCVLVRVGLYSSL